MEKKYKGTRVPLYESDEKNQWKYPAETEGHKVTIYATDACNKCWERTGSLAKYQWN